MSRSTAEGVGAAPRLRALSVATVLALVAPGLAVAQSSDPQALEARITQLEQMVQALKAELEAQKAAAATPAPAPAAPAAPAIQSTPIMPAANPGTRFSFGGFIKLDAIATDTTDGEIPDGSVGRLFYLPSAIPVGGDDEGTDLDMSAQWSRFWFGADTDIDGHKVKAYLEADLFGGGSVLGNEIATNTYGLTIRHAYVSWDNWLAGQTWSNFQDVAALPDAIDFVGPTEGTIFVRQAQVRYTNGPWSVSVENPETTVTTFGGARVSSDDNNVPDLTARWLTKGDWGHFTLAGMARQFQYETAAFDEDEVGFAASVSGKWVLGKNDDIRYMVSGGSGIGRYLGFGLGSDTMQQADGSLEALDGLGGFLAWRHVFSSKWRGNLYYSAATYDNDPALTGFGVTERAQSWHANVIFSPLAKLDVGAELTWAQRELEDDQDGELRRLQMHVKYNF